MPSSRSIGSTVQQPLPVPQQQDFDFPADAHLLITTPSRILSWDSKGLHTIFTSSKSGIAAATESKDGSDILAVADKHTVVLHDTTRGQEKSWGLSNEEDEVRHLQYTTDSKSLFLSTKVTNSVQCYSTLRKRLLSPPQTLSSPPVALAVSPKEHLMISAEGSPPVAYLKDLMQNTAATLIQAQASSAPVAVAAFHPERANIFLLGFEDGTLAVFDASRLARVDGKGAYANQEQVGKGELGRLAELHRPVTANDGQKKHAITGAAFLPGFKSRAVTVGTDGRCKLVDFVEGGNILRTWHGKAPLTSVSVHALPAGSHRAPSPASRGSRSSAKLSTGNPGLSLIAVGTQDGRVLLYDALGLLQARKKLDDSSERIISIEWVAGQSPRSIRLLKNTTMASDLSAFSTPRQRSRRKGTPEQRLNSTARRLSQLKTQPQGIADTTLPSIPSPRKFTTHPDEIQEETTVRHKPSQHRDDVPREAGAYLDLFSPVKPVLQQRDGGRLQKAQSPPRSRPRISSQTFSNKSTPRVQEQHDAVAALLHDFTSAEKPVLDSSASVVLRPSPAKSRQLKPRKANSRASPLKTKRFHAGPSSGMAMVGDASRSIDMTETLDATVAANSRLLRDLHQMNSKSTGAHAGSILQSYAGKGKQAVDRGLAPLTVFPEPLPESRAPQPPQQQQALAPPAARQPVRTHIFGRGGRWPTDSVDESSWDDAEGQDDIWITSDEEHHKASTRRHHLFHRPPARQTSRSRVDANGTMSTGRGLIVEETSASPMQVDRAQKTVMSTTNPVTAQAQAPTEDAFSPGSQNVRNLFPRSSSLSPRKKRRSPKKRPPLTLEPPRNETTSNGLAAKPSESDGVTLDRPKAAPSMTSARDTPRSHTDDCCCGCERLTVKVRSLESDVGHMKGEILALRAALRKHGIPAPCMPRR